MNTKVVENDSPNMPPRSHADSDGEARSLVWLALRRAALWIGATLVLTVSIILPATAETVLHSFAPYLSGAYPGANVCMAPNGAFYGTTYAGGSGNAGVVWRVDKFGHQTILHAFTGGTDGGDPWGALLCDAAGDVYGTTAGGGSAGAGTVFKVDRHGHEIVLYSFTGGADGGNPFYGLVQDSAGNFYGTADSGGAYGAGVVFKLDTTGHETVLYSFTGGPDGGSPNNVIRDPLGNIYGTTYFGGTSGVGVVFKLDRHGNETVMYSFTGGADGGYPYAGVVEDWAGNLYGTANGGGASGWGVVFKLDSSGNESALYSFSGGSDGGAPSAGVTLDFLGNLYGTTTFGGSAGAGVVFKLDGRGNESVLYSFTGGTDGGYPEAGVVRDFFGNLYGNTSNGGASGLGALFKLDRANRESGLYGFPATDGSNPQSGVVQDAAGNLYGATNGGGLRGAGTIYKMDATGHYSTLYTFTGGVDGGNPFGGVILGSDGNLYGVAGGAGAYGTGLLFKMDSSGNETIVYTFTGGADGAYPNGVVMDAAGNLYGTTADGGSAGLGVVFKVDPSGHETVLHTFTGPDGKYPYAGVVLDSAGNLYGSTFYGGQGSGVVYKIDTGGNYTILHNFTFGADGGDPWGDLILDSSGNLYGTTWSGGPPSGDFPGVVFKIDPSLNFSVLYTFTGFSDGGGPRANLVLDSSGNLYGTTEYGGIGGCPYFGCGILFELNPGGQQTVLYSFSGGSDGSEPGTGLIRDAAGNLYGTTYYGGTSGAGVVFKVTPGEDSRVEAQSVYRSMDLSALRPNRRVPAVPAQNAKTGKGGCPDAVKGVVAPCKQ